MEEEEEEEKRKEEEEKMEEGRGDVKPPLIYNVPTNLSY